MQETTRIAGLIQERIDDTVSRHRQELSELGSDVYPLFDEARAYVAGGKRVRAQFALLGYRSIQAIDLFADQAHELAAVIDAACAIELFHAAALIHDDVIDRSDTRRGRPAAHRHFEALHQQQQYRSDAPHFGVSTAILLGDLLHAWADELFQVACEQTDDSNAAAAARKYFDRMRSEVALGQYLDMVEEQRSDFAEQRQQLERSTRVLIYKSAKYSVETPLLIGAALAGATEQQEQVLSDFGLPVGVAFQLHDDLLGVFGDTEITGKPAGDDLRGGKRTVLVTLARDTLPLAQRRLFDELLGDDALATDQLGVLRQTIRSSGAVAQVEQMIARNIARAEAALDHATLTPAARQKLVTLARQITHPHT